MRTNRPASSTTGVIPSKVPAPASAYTLCEHAATRPPLDPARRDPGAAARRASPASASTSWPRTSLPRRRVRRVRGRRAGRGRTRRTRGRGPGDWRVRGMATRPDARGRGAGTKVLQALVQHAWPTARRACGATRGPGALAVRAGRVRGHLGRVRDARIGPHYRMELADAPGRVGFRGVPRTSESSGSPPPMGSSTRMWCCPSRARDPGSSCSRRSSASAATSRRRPSGSPASAMSRSRPTCTGGSSPASRSTTTRPGWAGPSRPPSSSTTRSRSATRSTPCRRCASSPR